MARKPKLKTTVSDKLFEVLAFSLGCGSYCDARIVLKFCRECDLDPSAICTKIIERCRFSEMTH
jgi:hypothetical protein